MSSAPDSNILARRVVVVGGGIGALELVLALRDLTGDRLPVTVIAPGDRFVLPPMTVAEPFAAGGHADVGPIAEVFGHEGATFRRATIDSVDAERHVVVCDDGDEVAYDVLVLAPGACPRPAFEHGLTFGFGDKDALSGMLRDLEEGYFQSVAFVVPAGVLWPLPLYELALMTAHQVASMSRKARLTLVTAEEGPLGVFGPEASLAVRKLLDAAGVAVLAGMPPTVTRGRVHVGGAEDVVADRIVSLPLLEGPRVRGVPVNSRGFIAVDGFCRVPGLQDVYAIGDATDLQVKQGGLACQQADVVAAHIAAAAGAEVPAEPLHPVLRGRLMTGRADRFLRHDLSGVHGRADYEPLWWPPAKVAGRHLGPWLAARGLARTAERAAPPEGIEVEVPLRNMGEPLAHRHPDVLGMEPLGPMRS